ncbi:MAG: hypothetical protein QM715_13605 [Nibricoccus sp.]
MSSHTTRKSFLAQMLGVLASVGLASKLVARPAAAATQTATESATPVKVSAEPRAVARSQDSV